LVDIASVRNYFEYWGGDIIFLLDKTKTNSSVFPANFKDLPTNCIFAFDEENVVIKQIENLKGHELSENLPVIIVTDMDGNLFYFSEGYKIGVGEQIAKEIKRLK
jgi:hypothetical protein